MPQASDELRAEMQRLFGDDVDDYGPIRFLRSKGYKLTSHWFWEPPPHVKSYVDMTQDEWFCLSFLCNEWDFGGFVENRE